MLGMTHDPEKKRESKGRRKVFASVQLSEKELLGKGAPKGTSPSGEENRPTCYAFKKSEIPYRDRM